MIDARSVNHHDLSPHMPGISTPQAKKRRADRTFRDEQLDMDFFIALLVVHLPPGKVLLSLDRTNWEHGETPINFLVLGAVVHGFTLPLIWVPLAESGNSHTYARMWLVLKLLRVLPAKRWQGLVADREFIGAEWFRFLRRQGIKRAIRIRHSDMLDDMNGKEWFKHVQHGYFHEIDEKVFVFGELMRVVATRSSTGDLVIIATDFSARKTWKLYKQRWSIECTFSSFKKRGFDLERTGMTERSRLQRLFGLVTLAWMFCLRLGVWLSQTHPIPVLKHGRREVSLVQHGAQHLVDALRWKPKQFMAVLDLLTQPFCPPGGAGSEVVTY
ncbi:IS4 family transposase [Deinococcus sp. SL84]|uniref:IS4 family transposase n=1 Tax=Deinococcus sp. SL84 TaxID=2994663 RepID=UPI00227323E2|nr:IS4 family transposase [Deinococcus sp. SL84]MCY1704318.1 IS4 family transposase [Deinococcus sp. SL84]